MVFLDMVQNVGKKKRNKWIKKDCFWKFITCNFYKVLTKNNNFEISTSYKRVNNFPSKTMRKVMRFVSKYQLNNFQEQFELKYCGKSVV